ncbi:GNAT family N-acetyltransferase [Streptomyces sp. NBC_00354]|uniref:GNAT family N-acetyltransferase n=1 Tax=Streptomyces sp. NBC_00354 TaxID=2975723 RepID=UPI002E264201|nr:GNAT family N-acetyltransferase [Streptomyces sp. NBC_01001]
MLHTLLPTAVPIDVHATIDSVTGWDEAVAAAPVFYRLPFLKAFEIAPLHPVLRHAYLHNPQRGIAVPVTLQHGIDPMGVLGTHFPAARERPVLLSHVWHCYETVLPRADTHPDSAAAVLRTLRKLADRWDAGHFGFVNVPAHSPTAVALERLGMAPVPAENGHGLDLTPFRELDDYLATLASKPRRNLTHDLRRAQEAVVETEILAPAKADLDGFVALARATASKYGNADYYRPGIFQDFVLALGGCARVIELRRAGHLIASAITLLDQHRYHFWCVGVDYAAAPGFSPFYTVFADVMRDAIASGRSHLELGRRNPDFKRRYGLRATPLCAYIEAV